MIYLEFRAELDITHQLRVPSRLVLKEYCASQPLRVGVTAGLGAGEGSSNRLVPPAAEKGREKEEMEARDRLAAPTALLPMTAWAALSALLRTLENRLGALRGGERDCNGAELNDGPHVCTQYARSFARASGPLPQCLLSLHRNCRTCNYGGKLLHVPQHKASARGNVAREVKDR
jgi:hypothetical protein